MADAGAELIMARGDAVVEDDVEGGSEEGSSWAASVSSSSTPFIKKSYYVGFDLFFPNDSCQHQHQFNLLNSLE